MVNENKSFVDILSPLKRDTIRRNAQRSVSWMINKIKVASQNKSNVATKPRIGGMYLYVYDAKTKDDLPFWDSNPLIIPVDFTKDGFFGINFHYLTPNNRKILLEVLGGFDNKNRKTIQISYGKLKTLGSTIWKFAFKRYLYSHMKTRFIKIDKEEWSEAIMLPIAKFNKMTQTSVYKQMK